MNKYFSITIAVALVLASGMAFGECSKGGRCSKSGEQSRGYDQMNHRMVDDGHRSQPEELTMVEI